MQFLSMARAGWVVLLLLAGPALAQPLPTESFFQNETFTEARLSPSGRYLALGVMPKGERTRLVVMDTATLQGRVAASLSSGDIGFFDWVNDERLVFSTSDLRLAPRNDSITGALFAVERDKPEYEQLTSTWERHRYHATTRLRDSEDIFIERLAFDGRSKAWTYGLQRMNTRTRRSTTVNAPGEVSRWLMDEKDEARIAVIVKDGFKALRYLDPATKAWTALPVGGEGESEEIVAPVGFAPDGTLYVTRHDGDKKALYRYDLAKRQVDPAPLVTLADYDFDGELVQDARHLLGVRYLGDARSTVWFDERMKEPQARIDKLLPATVNVVTPPLRGETPVVLLLAYSDVDPGRYYLFNTESGKLTEVGTKRREIDPRRMAPMDLVRYEARDGLKIPAWLTVPKDGKGKKLPLVVMVHGGPWSRQEWEWRAETQFLAARGYAVLEPEFRGSKGFGWAHFSKGFKEWGLAMQDDIADGARWAIAQGMADPDRICIAGGSYGGYSTLMGLLRNPELFKCGVAWAGVTDIHLMYSNTWSDLDDNDKRYTMPFMIGDPKQDAELLKAASPLAQAERIRQPLLLAHGSVDRRVPLEHYLQFRKAVRRTNDHVESLEYIDEAHSWKLVETRVDFWTHVENFLRKNIGSK